MLYFDNMEKADADKVFNEVYTKAHKMLCDACDSSDLIINHTEKAIMCFGVDGILGEIKKAEESINEVQKMLTVATYLYYESKLLNDKFELGYKHCK